MHSKYIFDAVESHHSECKYVARIRWIKYCLIRWTDRQKPGFSFETQQPQIYTLNADSDIIHVFLTWGNNRLCSFTNRGELCTNSLGLPKLGRWLYFGINLSVLTPGLPVSTSSSTPNDKHHISHNSRVDDRKGVRPCRQEKMGW
jgi:hypothetical protein